MKQETLTYTEAAKKEERIFNSTMMSKQETLEEVAEIICHTHKTPIEQANEIIKLVQDKNKYSEEEVEG
jgi:hypothetical protein